MGGGVWVLLLMAFGGLVIFSGLPSEAEEDDDRDADTPPEGEQPPEIGAPNFFDDTEDADNGLLFVSGNGTIASGGITANGTGAEDADDTTPDDVFQIAAGADEDVTILGGVGDDVFLDGASDGGSAVLVGGAGDDTFDLGDGLTSAASFGGEGDDLYQSTMEFGVFHGGDGNDEATLINGTQAAFGDAGDDILQAPSGGPEDDFYLLDGGSGNDFLAASNLGSHQSVLNGGIGNDQFSISRTVAEVAPVAAGDQTIADFGDDDGGAGDGDATNNDYVDLWRVYNSLSAAKADFAEDGDFDQVKGVVFEGLTADDLTEDNTGLSDTPNFVEAQAVLTFGPENEVNLFPRPIVGGGAITYVNWGDGALGGPLAGASNFYQHTFETDGPFTVSFGVESLSSENIDIVSFIVDPTAETITPTDPVARWF